MRTIIIGAGIGGLTTALALKQKGIDVAVYERTAILTEMSARASRSGRTPSRRSISSD